MIKRLVYLKSSGAVKVKVQKFAMDVPYDMVQHAMCFEAEPNKTVVFELEALAVVLALGVLEPFLKRRSAVFLTDNAGVEALEGLNCSWVVLVVL